MSATTAEGWSERQAIAASAEAFALGWPTIDGPEGVPDWAVTIRRESVGRVDEWIRRQAVESTEGVRLDLAELGRHVRTWMLSQTDGVFWIRGRRNTVDEWIELARAAVPRVATLASADRHAAIDRFDRGMERDCEAAPEAERASRRELARLVLDWMRAREDDAFWADLRDRSAFDCVVLAMREDPSILAYVRAALGGGTRRQA